MGSERLVKIAWDLFQQKHPGAGAYMFYVTHHGTLAPEIIAYNAEKQLFCASAFKAYVLAQCVRCIEAGQLDPNADLTITDYNKSPGGHYWNYVPGTKVKVAAAMAEMIHHSDNTATDMLLDKVGAQNVRDLLAAHQIVDVNIPDSTRAFIIKCFELGADEGPPTTKKIAQALDNGHPHSPYDPKNTQRMDSSAIAFRLFYDAASARHSPWFDTDAARDMFRGVLATTPAGMQMALQIPGTDVIFFKGGTLDLQPYNVASGAGKLTVRDPKSSIVHVDFACMFNGSQATDHGALLADFQGTLVNMLKYVTSTAQ